MKPADLLQLAIVADKYDCINAINLALDALFPMSAIGLDILSTRDLLVSAFLLDHPNRFSSFTREMVTCHTDSFAKIGVTETAQRIPAIAWLTLESQRSEFLREYVIACSQLLTRPLNANTRNCKALAGWYSDLVESYNASGLGGLNGTNSNILSIWNKVSIKRPFLGPKAGGIRGAQRLETPWIQLALY